MVKNSAELINALDTSDPLFQAITKAAEDTGGRADTNTTAAFSVGLLVGLYYLVQAFFPPKEESF